MTLTKYAKGRGVLFIHMPSEGKRNVVSASNLKRAGWCKGFPDYIFPENRRGYSGLAIELKRDEKTARASKEQVWWLEQLERRGWHGVVCHGADAAIRIIDWYFEDAWPANNVWHSWPNDFYNDVINF